MTATHLRVAHRVSSGATVTRDELHDLTACPADRLWRYPICHAMVPWAARTPLTPNAVTVTHSLLAMAGGCFIARGTLLDLLVAGLLFEARATLDCFDGVLARATKRSSPIGRALDQLGDIVGTASLMVGAAVLFTRVWGAPTAWAMVLLASFVTGLGSAAWDLYRRRFTSLLVEGRDVTEDEYVALGRACRQRPATLLAVSFAVQTFQWRILGPHTLPRLRARIALDRDAAPPADGTAAGRALRAAAARDDRALRAVLLRVGFVGGDTTLLLFTASLLMGRFVQAFPLVTLCAAGAWGLTVLRVNRYLQHLAPHDRDHEHAHAA